MSDSEAIKGTDERYCGDCGAIIKVRAEICPKCGIRQAGVAAPVVHTPTTPARKKRVTAAVLAFLLGGAGAHKFYLGQIGLGILYLAFCWTFIPAIMALVEFVIYISMSDEEFERKYNA